MASCYFVRLPHSEPLTGNLGFRVLSEGGGSSYSSTDRSSTVSGDRAGGMTKCGQAHFRCSPAFPADTRLQRVLQAGITLRRTAPDNDGSGPRQRKGTGMLKPQALEAVKPSGRKATDRKATDRRTQVATIQRPKVVRRDTIAASGDQVLRQAPPLRTTRLRIRSCDGRTVTRSFWPTAKSSKTSFLRPSNSFLSCARMRTLSATSTCT